MLAHILNEWGARAIVFDIIFSEKSEDFDDGALREALEKAPGKIYLPSVLEFKGSDKIWIKSLPEFTKSARPSGHINITPDSDGTMRRVKPELDYGGEKQRHLAIQVAEDVLAEEGRPTPYLPLDEQGRLFINWAGTWKDTFEHYSYWDILKSYESLKKGEKPLVDPEKIRGKILLIGLTAFGHADIKANPIEPAYPAVGVHANVINNILNRDFVRPVSKLWNGAVMVLVYAVCSFIFFPFHRTRSVLLGLLVAGSWVAASYFMFAKKGLWFDVFQPLLLIFTFFAYCAVYTLVLNQRERARLFQLATRDGLTGLFVIRHFRTLLNQAAIESGRTKKPLSLLLLDIDHFKKINDTYGHLAGDRILKELASILQTYVRVKRTTADVDSVGRYGGEEFIVMLKNCKIQDAVFQVAERLRKIVEKTQVEWEGHKIPFTISIGVAMLRPEETVPDFMVRRADEALYRAKESGRNQVCVETEKLP